jgi:chemotaxis protein MotB
MAARRRKHQEHENLERWLLTYADMITLLMAFFIMLYGMSQLDIRKFQAMLGGVRAELGGTGVLSGGAGINSGGASPMGQQSKGFAPRPGAGATTQLRQLMDKSLAELPEQGDIEVVTQGSVVVVRIPADSLRFAPGSAALLPGMAPVLARIGELANRQYCLIRVAGHTCDLPVNSGLYTSNWELSADRARNVALHLVRCQGVAPERLSCMGYADTRPLVPNRDEARRRRNRRVELLLTPQTGNSATVSAAPGASPALDIRPTPVDLLEKLHGTSTTTTGRTTPRQVH